MFDPLKLLDEHYNQQLSDVDRAFGEQESMIQEQFNGQARQMQQRYGLERRFIEETPMDEEQRYKRVLALNQKYELSLHDLKGEAAPHFQELQAKRMQAQRKIDAWKQEASGRMKVVEELSQKGLLADPTAALQEQLQVLGVSVPISAMRPPSREKQLQALQTELRQVEDVLNQFQMKKGEPVAYDAVGWEMVQGRRKARSRETKIKKGDELHQAYQAAHGRYVELRRQMGGLLVPEAQGQGQRPYRLSDALRIAGSLRSGNPLAVKATELVDKQGPAKSLSREQAMTLLAEAGGDKEKARKLARERGYRF